MSTESARQRKAPRVRALHLARQHASSALHPERAEDANPASVKARTSIVAAYEAFPKRQAGRDSSFWAFDKRLAAKDPRAVFHSLLYRVKECAPVHLYDAVEEGVPTLVVLLIANAFGGSRESVMNLIGVSETTFRRNESEQKPLPEVAGHRVMGFLRIVATLQRLLEESGDPTEVENFDLEAWVNDWIREPLPELGGKTPAEMLRNPEGQRAVEALLERMRGGLPA